MPDITMCTGDHCPKKKHCHRYRAAPTPLRQAYFVKPPCEGKDYTNCDYFWRREKNGG